MPYRAPQSARLCGFQAAVARPENVLLHIAPQHSGQLAVVQAQQQRAVVGHLLRQPVQRRLALANGDTLAERHQPRAPGVAQLALRRRAVRLERSVARIQPPHAYW